MNPNDTRWKKNADVDAKLAVRKVIQLVTDSMEKLDRAKEMTEDAGQNLFSANNTVKDALKGLRGQEDTPAFGILKELADSIDAQVSYYSRNKPAEHLSRMWGELTNDINSLYQK